MQRFYLPSSLADRPVVSDPDFVHQISRVMRGKPGDRVTLFGDAGGGEYEIVSIEKRDVTLVKVRDVKPSGDSSARIVLFQALPNKHEKIEYLLQKGTEVGISEFVFFTAERSQKLAITPNKIARFEAIVREAVEQCGGFRMPSIRFVEAVPAGFDFPVAMLHTDPECGAVDIGKFAQKTATEKTIGLLVGPEGGFSSNEVVSFTKSGATAVRAGDRILRTETAGPVATFFFLRTFPN
jgi:16S rRNA (uracil1498-N3)-methyltransferase